MTREEALFYLKTVQNFFKEESSHYLAFEYAVDALENTPNIVRCGECIHWEDGYCKLLDWSQPIDGYCSNGKGESDADRSDDR